MIPQKTKKILGENFDTLTTNKIVTKKTIFKSEKERRDSLRELKPIAVLPRDKDSRICK